MCAGRHTTAIGYRQIFLVLNQGFDLHFNWGASISAFPYPLTKDPTQLFCTDAAMLTGYVLHPAVGDAVTEASSQ